jgi:hypothetical protein
VLARIRPTPLGLWSFAVAYRSILVSAAPPISTAATRRQAPSST